MAKITPTMRDKKLLKLLVARKRMTRKDVPRVLGVMHRGQLPLDHVLQDLGYATERDILTATAKIQGYKFVDVPALNPDPEVMAILSETVAIKYRAMVVKVSGDLVYVACGDPGNLEATDAVTRDLRGKRVEFLLGSGGQIAKKLGEYRDHYKALRVQRLLSEVQDEGSDLAKRLGIQVSLERVAQESNTIIRTLNLLLLQALIRRTSDIHINPTAKNVLAQYRIDGILHTVQRLPSTILQGLVNRIKILADMDIADRRLPQDGSFHIEIEGRHIDFRVATTPTIHGEKVVMRILEKQATLLGLESLGFTNEHYLTLRRMLRLPNGIILVGGPTGSGKTTTLYAALQSLITGTRNITTIEDPVEYQIDGVTQIQVEEDIGLTFGKVLRSVLRQDPDVILVGEIRDTDTMKNAVQASLTGHLVLATIHSNDAVSAISRIIDLGCSPFLLATSLRAVVSQRLVRSICASCKETVEADPEILSVLPAHMSTLATKTDNDDMLWGAISQNLAQTKIGKGCPRCFNTGFRGRSTIAEILRPNETIRNLILEQASHAEMFAAAVESEMTTIFDDGITKVKQGITTIEEVLAATQTTEEVAFDLMNVESDDDTPTKAQTEMLKFEVPKE